VVNHIFEREPARETPAILGASSPLSREREKERGSEKERGGKRERARERERKRDRERERERERTRTRERVRVCERERAKKGDLCALLPFKRYGIQGYFAHKKTQPPLGHP